MNLLMIWKLEVNNLIIVESANDKYFIEKLNLDNIEIGKPICNVNDFNCLASKDNLKTRLNALELDSYGRIGIILDADLEGIEQRIVEINNALKSICNDISIEKINQFYRSDEVDLEIACYIMNIDGKGELEDIMKEVKSKDSTYADCLEAWRNCLESKGITIKDKEFVKIWMSHYLKYDTCLGKDKNQKSKKCSNELINNTENTENTEEIENNLKSNAFTIKKDIWNFKHPVLAELKEFLVLFD